MRKLGNEEEVKRNALAEELSVYSTLAKCVPQKRCVRTVRSARKETKGFRRDLRRDLEKKGCKKGVVSL